MDRPMVGEALIPEALCMDRELCRLWRPFIPEFGGRALATLMLNMESAIDMESSWMVT